MVLSQEVVACLHLVLARNAFVPSNFEVFSIEVQNMWSIDLDAQGPKMLIGPTRVRLEVAW